MLVNVLSILSQVSIIKLQNTVIIAVLAALTGAGVAASFFDTETATNHQRNNGLLDHRNNSPLKARLEHIHVIDATEHFDVIDANTRGAGRRYHF